MHVKLILESGEYLKDGNGNDVIIKNIAAPRYLLDTIWSKKFGATGFEEVFIKPSMEAMVKMIRGRRDKLLAESDWTQFPDSPLSKEEKAAWKKYRKELRDMINDVSVDDPEWPVNPNGQR